MMQTGGLFRPSAQDQAQLAQLNKAQSACASEHLHENSRTLHRAWSNGPGLTPSGWRCWSVPSQDGRLGHLQAISGARFASPFAQTAQNADAGPELPVKECAIFNRHKWEVFVRR